MSKLTLDNGFIYSDFKDRHLTWLPLYRYWGALIIWATSSYSLVVMNVINSVLGALTAVLACWFGIQILDKKTGLLVGLAISITPYLVVFSVVSMAEILGALVLLAWFVSLYNDKYELALLCAFLAALTRYELIFLIGISVFLFTYLKNYKAAVYSALGLFLGLGIWSYWAFVNSGNPLNWLLMRFQSTTLSNNFYTGGNTWKDDVLIPLATLLQVFPLVAFFIWFKRPKTVSKTKAEKWVFIMGFITLSHWLFFFVAQLKVIAYPDPRFFIISLPITTLWFFALFQNGYFRKFVTQRVIFFLLGLSLIQLIVPFYRQYSIQPRIDVGHWIKEHINTKEVIWSDLAVAIVESDRSPDLYISSDNLIPKKSRNSELQNKWISSRLDSLNIEYLTSYNAPFDYTQQVWPQIKNLEPFEWEGYTFIPLYYNRPFVRDKASLHAILREKFEAGREVASIWKVYKN